MPGIYDQSMTRKRFLHVTTGAFGALAIGRATSLWARPSEAAEGEEVRLALLSDTHIPADAKNEYRGFMPVENLKQVVPQACQAKPAATIISGDAARLDGQVADYQALRAILQPLAEAGPIYIGLGNHDDRQNFFQVFGTEHDARQEVQRKYVLQLETAPVRLIVLDSLLYVNKVAGLLGKAQREWLAGHLQHSDDKPTVLVVHHTLGDGDGDLLDVDRLFHLIRPHANVKAIFYGHSHRYAVEQKNGVQLVNLPAVGYNFADSEPVGWVEAVFSTQGVDLTLHAIGGNRQQDGKTTQVRWS
jgi:3',5'-cyclic AMP phosphodiesterase CpdA